MEDHRHVIDKRTIKLEDVMKDDYIPFLSGRPDREKIIGKDDITNVEILLNTTATVDDLIAKL